MDIKPGYMFGAKPRQQAVGHVIGIAAGACAAVPVYSLIVGSDLSLLASDALPMPGAQVWRAVAELLARGFSSLHTAAVWAIVIGAALGLAMEWANLRMAGRFPISGVGLAAVVTFPDALSMSVGSLVFWILGRSLRRPGTTAHRTFVENRETLCAGIIAGGALVGIVLIVLETALLR